jgi:hypothetical protein
MDLPFTPVCLFPLNILPGINAQRNAITGLDIFPSSRANDGIIQPSIKWCSSTKRIFLQGFIGRLALYIHHHSRGDN